MSEERFLTQQAEFWSGNIQQHGANYRGVDYGNAERQDLCFAQLTKIWRDPAPASVLDYGCGYGALLEYLVKRGFGLSQYTGFDISERMLEKARETNRHIPHHTFTSDLQRLGPADYVISGGVFNVKLDADRNQWQTYMLATLDRQWTFARKGMAFNVLTSYSDPEKMRSDLFYADPCVFFDYCKRNYSRDVALLHDYGVYEFTMLVRRS